MRRHDVLRVGDDLRRRGDRVARRIWARSRSGKLADLQVLDANPLENIRNTNSMRYVMKNGRLYDAQHVRRDVAAAEGDGEAVVDVRRRPVGTVRRFDVA